jgi:hypothetical protein
MLHYVPKDRPPTDLDHRLGPNFGFFGHPRAEAAGENYDFHGFLCLARVPI